MHVFRLWEEARVLGENPGRHRGGHANSIQKHSRRFWTRTFVAVPVAEWNLMVLMHNKDSLVLGYPLCVGVSLASAP